MPNPRMPISMKFIAWGQEKKCKARECLACMDTIAWGLMGEAPTIFHSGSRFGNSRRQNFTKRIYSSANSLPTHKNNIFEKIC